jgi:hypothetical protein
MVGGPAAPDGDFEADTVVRPIDGDGRLLAFRWASRTSGSAGSAMWLLLVPYMLLNLAGWALPPASDRRHRIAVATTRIAGLFLTLTFALITANGVIGVGSYQVLRRWISWDASLTFGIAASALIMGVLWFATTRADDARNDRPHLRAPHIAVALWGVWATAATAVAEAGDRANPIGTMWLLPASLAVLVAAASVWRGLEDVTRVFGRVAVGASGLLLLAVAVNPDELVGSPAPMLITIGGPLRGAVIAYAISALAATALAWSRTHRDAGPAVASLLALAGSTGAAVGAGAVVVAGSLFGVGPATAAGTLAEAFLIGTMLVLAALAVHMWTHLEPGSTPRERLFLTLVSVRDDLRPILLTIPVVTLAVGAVALARLDDVLPWLAAGAVAVSAVALSLVAARLGFRKAAAGIASVMTGSTAAVATGLVGFRTLAVAFALVLPLVAVAVRVTGAFRSEESRRTLAIPWDIGSFFSRRFHPFAPPTYRDVVQRDLTSVLEQLRSRGTPVVVSAHSQGSIVAAAALDSMPDPALRFLTHGSPLATLYMRFFPVSFPPQVATRADRPWINLWRPTDPVGGSIRGTDDRRVADTHLRIHGGYWLADETEYATAVTDLTRQESRG